MNSEESIDGIRFKCSNHISVDGSKLKKKICGRKFTVRRYSWFSKSHLKMSEILSLTYYWWNNLPLSFVEHELDLGKLYNIFPIRLILRLYYYISTYTILILILSVKLILVLYLYFNIAIYI